MCSLPLACASAFGLAEKDNKGGPATVFVSAGSRENFPKTHVASP